jgi:hypothetical protein
VINLSRKRIFFFTIILICCSNLWTQPSKSNDDPFLKLQDASINTNQEKPVLNTILDNFINKPGLALFTDYSIVGAYYPGWAFSPWEKDFNVKKTEPTDPLTIGAEIRARIGLNIRLSPIFNFWQAVNLSLPGMTFEFTEFYGDYILLDRAFFKIGKYDYGWGFSQANFRYTDLLARVPNQNPQGNLYLGKVLIPVAFFGNNLGDIELLTFTRDGYINTSNPEFKEFAFGWKLNFRQRWADIDIGTLYFKQMPLRTFLSAKTTLFSSTEVYVESLLSVDHTTWDNILFSCSAGFYNDFLNNKIKINGEIFYNGENAVYFFRQENFLEEKKKIYPFIPGLNLAFNLDYKPGFFWKLRFGIQFRYAVDDGSGQLIPGISMEPAQHFKIYMATPLVVGTRSENVYSYYYANSEKRNRPFSFILAVSLSGSFEFVRY